MPKSKIKSPKSELQPLTRSKLRPRRRPDSVESQPRPRRRPDSVTKPQPRPRLRPDSVTKPQPRPRLRPDSVTKSSDSVTKSSDSSISKEKMFEINHYTVDGEIVPYILFKDDKTMSFGEIEDRFYKSKTAPETQVGRETSKQILKFLQKHNPTKQEFINFWFSKKANKGGLIINKRTGHRDMRKSGLFK